MYRSEWTENTANFCHRLSDDEDDEIDEEENNNNIVAAAAAKGQNPPRRCSVIVHEAKQRFATRFDSSSDYSSGGE